MANAMWCGCRKPEELATVEYHKFMIEHPIKILMSPAGYPETWLFCAKGVVAMKDRVWVVFGSESIDWRVEYDRHLASCGRETLRRAREIHGRWREQWLAGLRGISQRLREMVPMCSEDAALSNLSYSLRVLSHDLDAAVGALRTEMAKQGMDSIGDETDFAPGTVVSFIMKQQGEQRVMQGTVKAMENEDLVQVEGDDGNVYVVSSYLVKVGK